MEYLSIIAIGNCQSNVIGTLTSLITKYDLHILRSRITALESEQAIISLVSGSWNSIAKLESALKNLEDNLDINIILKRTNSSEHNINLLPYHINIIGIDESEIINEICTFFTSQNIQVDSLDLETEVIHSTDTPIFNLNLSINIPCNLSIASIREQFLTMCDDLNIDGVMEPGKRI